MSGVQEIRLEDDEAEQRLDRWFRRRWPHLSQSRIERMCRKGEIRVDGGRVKAASRIAPGQVVRVPPIPDGAAPPRLPVQSAPNPEAVKDMVVFMDQHLIVLNKPPGMPVQGGSKVSDHLGRLLPALSFERPEPPRLVHRLDRDTSGLLVLARTGRAATELGKLFRTREVNKTYLAAVAGKPDPVAGTIRYGLRKAGQAGNEKMHVVAPDQVAAMAGAQHATTDYRVLEQYAGRLAIVALRPVTGRTHQLRAHMAALGCPIAGDGKYADRSSENRGDGWGAGLGQGLSRKLHLHAARLSFVHPISSRRCVFTAPLPEHMARTWSAFGANTDELEGDPFNEI